MSMENRSFVEALEEVRQSRPIVSPNLGFRKQLSLWFDMGFTLEGSSRAHAIYKMECVARQMARGTDFSQISLPYADNPTESYYMCTNCQAGIFAQDHLIHHEKGVNRWGLKDPNCENLECRGHFLRVINWMKVQIENGESGDLVCPNCAIILGSWNWRPLNCTCKSSVVPSFIILKAKVSFSGNW